MRARCLGLLVLAAARAAAADSADEESRALTVAESALEYRDFDKAVEVLHPWVHPPRIQDPKRMLRARRVLGISEHSRGNVAAARDEFGQLLLLDPDYKLDPFTVPPAVIETLEAVRGEMKPTLDRLRKERGTLVKPDPPALPVAVTVPVETVHPLMNMMPFGVPQFVQDEPLLGGVFLGVQGVGLAANIGGFFRGRDRQKDDPEQPTLRAVQYAGLATFLAAWAVSGALGFLNGPSYNAALLRDARKPPAPPPPGAPTLGGELGRVLGGP